MTALAEIASRQVIGLNATIDHAITETRYYREAFTGVDPVLVSVGDLSRFPLLDRRTLVERGTDLLAAGTVPEYVTITSGTTFEERAAPAPLFHYQTEAERRVEAALLGALIERAPRPQPLMLRLVVANHGIEALPAVPGCFALPLEKPYHFAAVASLLGREFGFPGFTPRIRSLMGPLNLLKLLTLRLGETGVDPRSFGIERVTSYSWLLTSRWRDLLESAWGARVEDIYGVSEVPGLTGHRCFDCDRYHMSDLAVVEFLATDRDVPVERGPARLVATALYPLAQAQPIIRYDTDDIVDVGEACQTTGRIGIELLGRRRDVVVGQVEDGPVPLVWPMALHDLLDSLPDVAANDDPRARTVGLHSGFGTLKYRLERRDRGGTVALHLGVEVRWSPGQNPAAAAGLQARIRERVLDRFAALRSAIAGGGASLDIELHEPGSTDFAAVY